MGAQFDAAWTRSGVKLEKGMHFLVTEDVAYGPDGATVFPAWKGFHITGFEYDYDYNVTQCELSTSLKDWLSISEIEERLESGEFRLISEPRS